MEQFEKLLREQLKQYGILQDLNLLIFLNRDGTGITVRFEGVEDRLELSLEYLERVKNFTIVSDIKNYLGMIARQQFRAKHFFQVVQKNGENIWHAESGKIQSGFYTFKSYESGKLIHLNIDVIQMIIEH